MKRTVFFQTFVIIFLLFLSGHTQVSAQPPVSAFALNRQIQFLPVGGTDSLYLSIVDVNYSSYDMNNLGLAWFPRDPDIASVDRNGVVTANRPGETIISAISIAYPQISIPCTLTVFRPRYPVVYIEVDREIPDEPKISGYMRAVSPQDSIMFDGPIGIEVRGSSTKGFPKKQYAIETRSVDHPDSNYNIPFMGLPTENDWVFNAPYTDKSHLRNVIIYHMSNSMGRYASRYRFFELYLNGDYRGLYVLLEKIKRDNDRVNIRANRDTVADKSFIIKRDKFDGGDNEHFELPHAQKIQYHYPKPRDITPQEIQFIRSYISNVENVLYSSYFTHLTSGYAKYLDVDSWVDYLLLQNISKNNDGFHFSNFFYRDRGGKLVHGPIWDFNLAFGNVNYNDNEKTDGWWYWFWNRQLMNDPRFQAKVYERWWELREDQFKPENIFHFIDSTAASIDAEQKRNFKRWPTLGTYIWPNNVFPATYGEEITYLKQWIQARIDWIDDNIGEFTDERVGVSSPTSPTPQSYELGQNFPNPFNPVTTIHYTIPGVSHVKLEIFNVSGQSVAMLENKIKSAGHYEITWDAPGLASGIYFYRLVTPKYSATRKMLLLK